MSYNAAETLARTFEMVPESRVSAATTATTITPSTTAYSAIVWPLSSWLSANISVGDSIKGIHLLGRRRGAPPTQHRRDLPGGPYPDGVLPARPHEPHSDASEHLRRTILGLRKRLG